MNNLRFATQEEIDSIASTSDLPSNGDAVVLAQDTPNGPIFGVAKRVTELDPVHFPEGTPKIATARFIRDCEIFLMGKGVDAYYFNVAATSEMGPWRENIEHWGAFTTSPTPEYRYKKRLI